MSTSARPAAEDALLALILADVTLQAVGPPQLFMPVAMKKEHVWVSENSELTQSAFLTAGTTANVQREENFEIHVIVAVEKLGDDYVAIRTQGVALVAALENIVRANATLSGTVFYAEVTSIERRSGTTDRQRFVDHDVTVACKAYITGA